MLFSFNVFLGRYTVHLRIITALQHYSVTMVTCLHIVFKLLNIEKNSIMLSDIQIYYKHVSLI